MKLKFWKKQKPPSEGQMVGYAITKEAFDFMKSKIDSGVLVDFALLDRYIRIEHFPEYVGPNKPPGKTAWVFTFDVWLMDAKGTWYGTKGVEIINAVGLPGVQEGIEIIDENNGRAIFKTDHCPSPPALEHLARTIETRATIILEEYRRFEVMGRARKKT